MGLHRRLARSTIACYQGWIKDFLRHSRSGGRWRPPAELGAEDVERYLSHLASDRRVSASTQNQALCAVVFLYRHVLVDELGPDHLGRFAALNTTMIYTHVMNKPAVTVTSPLDRLGTGALERLAVVG